MKSKFEIFLDTGIFTDKTEYGTITKDTLLSKCLKLFECYTSVINASEIFSDCKSNKDTELAKNSFNGVNILGIPFRYSVKIGEIHRLIKKKILTIITEMRLCLQCAPRPNYLY